MRATPVRFLNAAAWPLTIWISLTHLDEHSADDYVERTMPIVATAVAFWLCAIGLAVLATPELIPISATFEGRTIVGAVRGSVPENVVSVLWLFAPFLYVVGFWLFTARDEAYPR